MWKRETRLSITSSQAASNIFNNNRDLITSEKADLRVWFYIMQHICSVLQPQPHNTTSITDYNTKY